MIVIYNRQNEKIATFVFHQGNEGFLFSEISLVISFQITPFIKDQNRFLHKKVKFKFLHSLVRGV